MSWPLLLALPLISALLATLALPWFDYGLLAWVGLAPLLLALRQRGVVAGAALGLLFGWSFGAGTFYWIKVIDGVTVLRFGLLACAFSVYYGVFGALYALASRRLGPYMILGGPVLWVALEYARASAGFVALPWNLLAHSQYRYLPAIQIADVAGVYGVSFVLVMANQLLSEGPDILAGRQAHAALHGAAVAAALALTLGYGWQELAMAGDAPAHLRVAIVQANVAPRSGMTPKEQVAHLAAYDRLTRQVVKERPALVVWPSSSLPGPIDFFMVRLYLNNIAQRAGAHVLAGGAGGDKFAAPSEGRLPYSNSEFLISPSGALEGQYNKMQLTPFTEYVPLQGTVTWPRWITARERSFVAGEAHTLFEVAQARFGAPICWENAFADLFRRFVLNGADFMVSVTNEGAFGATSAPHQTLAINVFRAVENRVAIARAATTGVSAFIDPQGRIVSRVQDARGHDLFVPGTLVWDVPLSARRSLYTVHGDVFAGAVVLAAVLMLALCVFSTRPAGAPSREPAPAGRHPGGVRS